MIPLIWSCEVLDRSWNFLFGAAIQVVSKHEATSFPVKTENPSNRDRRFDRAVAEMYKQTISRTVRHSLSNAANLGGVQTRFFLVDVYKG
jgi:hypothetical protein